MNIHSRATSIPAATLLAFSCMAGFACKAEEQPSPKPADAPAVKMDQLQRAELNRLAAELDVPLFWNADDNNNGEPDANEIVTLWGTAKTNPPSWTQDGKLTPELRATYQKLVAAKTAAAPAGLSPEELERRALVKKELAQGKPTLVYNDFSEASEEDQSVVENVLEAAEIIERIYAKQSGTDRFAAQIPANDAASRMLFHRNQGPWCVAPETESNPSCSAVPSKPKHESGLYPASVQTDEKFCETLGKRKDAEMLLHQFVVVREDGAGGLKAVPYHEAYAAEMGEIAGKLEQAANDIKSPSEAPFQEYLRAAANAFRTDAWEAADEAWAKMNVHNSKWYLRIGPDEVYFEPCSRKAGFHVSFALINQDSLKWQNKLDPVKNDMEQALAALSGKPYKARDVSFHLPDFIDIVVNAGDSRNAHGATIGQSLPNWGPVANEGRGRTVAMTNLYSDPDSRESLESLTKSLYCADAMKTYTRDAEPQIMSTVLHEAAHNLGPAHEYAVNGKKAPEIFGGPLASTLEELKAQTAALYFTDWLATKNLITKEMADQAHTRDVVWGFGHISRGMYDSSNKPKPYSQLAAIQFNFLRKEGAIEWRPDELAANGKDQGCYLLALDRFPAAIEKLMKTVGSIKARGDKAGALKLRADLVDSAEVQPHLEAIRERWLRAPKASFVYAVDL